MNKKTPSPIFLALIISGLIISIAYYVSEKNRKDDLVSQNANNATTTSSLESVRGVQANDHILGNPEAPIVFFVYSDFSCPYCKKYHKTMESLLRIYGHEGEVAWVFRHMPFVQLHPESPMYALASECVADSAGNEGFWKFANTLFEKADPLNPVNAGDLVALAENAGADRQNFVTCMRSNKLMERVTMDFDEAMVAGGKGTPFTIVDIKGKRESFKGAEKLRVLALFVQNAIRTMKIDKVERPGGVTNINETSFAKEFEKFDSSVHTPTVGTSSVSTTTEKTSILDGIIN